MVFCSYETTSTTYGVTVSDRYTYCQKCFDNLPEVRDQLQYPPHCKYSIPETATVTPFSSQEGISMSENPSDKTNMVAKQQFSLLKNDNVDYEPFEHCKYCHRKWHKICALYDKKVSVIAN